MVWKEEASRTEACFSQANERTIVERIEQIILAPTFIQRANASTSFAALEAAIPALSLDAIFEASKSVDNIVLAIVSDMAPANIRMKSWIESRILQHNQTDGHGKVIFLDLFCVGHVLITIVIRAFALTKLIPKCHSINFTFRFPPKFNRLVRMLRNKIHSDLISGGYISGAEQSDQTAIWQLHTSRMLSLTLLRSLRTRGRDQSSSSGFNEDYLRELQRLLTTMLTGDIREPRVTHLCMGCCTGPADAAIKLSDGLQAAFVEQLVSKNPSTIKYYTMETALTSSGGLFMTHQLAPQVFPAAIDVQLDESLDNEGNEVQEDEMKFRRYCHRKAKQAKETAEDPESEVNLVLALWSGEPLEKLNNTLQHAEALGKCMLDATYRYGPIYQAEVELYRRSSSSPSTFYPLEFIEYHFSNRDDIDSIEVAHRGHAKCIEVNAQLWSRAVVLLENPPWSWLQLKDSRLSAEEHDELREKVVTTEECDLDPSCGKVFVEQATRDPAAIDHLVDGIFDGLAKHAPATNFALERLLALVRSASPTCRGRKPTASKVVSRGMLTQLLRRHCECGLPDARGKRKRRDLINDGVHINAVARKQRGTTTGARWHIRYGNHKVSEYLRTHGGTVVDADEIRRQAVREWTQTMTNNEKLSFKARWRLHTVSGENEGDAMNDADDEGERTKIMQTKASAWMSRLGTDRWPVAPSHVKASLLVHTTDTTPVAGRRGNTHGGGVCNRFASIRRKVEHGYFIKDENDIPENVKIRLPAACHQVHPGLCIRQHAEYYRATLKLAVCLEQHFVKELLHHFHLLLGFFADDDPPVEECVYFAHKRQRRRKTPISHVMVRSSLEDGEAYCQVRAPELYDFMTVWTLARQFCSLRCVKVTSVMLDFEDVAPNKGKFVVNTRLAEQVEIWPNPPPKSENAEDPDARDLIGNKTKPTGSTSRRASRPAGIDLVLPDGVPPEDGEPRLHRVAPSDASTSDSENDIEADSEYDPGVPCLARHTS